jgi:hypothetical protein
MKFVASRLMLGNFLSHLNEEVITAWTQLGKWSRSTEKEAKPLPLHVVVALESAMQGMTNSHDAYLLGVILLMVWPSLRWSDAQRVQLADFSRDRDSIMAWS